MFSWNDTRAIIMTEDRKCILKGNSKYNKTLCLVDESTKLKVKTFRGVKTAETEVKSKRIKLSKGVAELYNLDSRIYHKDSGVKLVGVKVKCKYETIE